MIHLHFVEISNLVSFRPVTSGTCERGYYSCRRASASFESSSVKICWRIWPVCEFPKRYKINKNWLYFIHLSRTSPSPWMDLHKILYRGRDPDVITCDNFLAIGQGIDLGNLFISVILCDIIGAAEPLSWNSRWLQPWGLWFWGSTSKINHKAMQIWCFPDKSEWWFDLSSHLVL